MGDEPTDNGGYVRFTVKEMFSDIRQSLSSIDHKLSEKADMAHVVLLSSRVDALEKLAANIQNTIDTASKVDTATFTKREKTAGLVIAAIAVVIPYVFRAGGLG